MLQVARLAPNVLGDAAALVESFLRAQQNSDGGFKARSGKSDLYYSVFGIEGLFALKRELPLESFTAFVNSFGDGAGLDLVHLSCLARCWANLPAEAVDQGMANAILQHIESHRSADSGYHATPGASAGTVYGCFLATGAYQDLRQPIPNPRGIIDCISSLKATDGGYANQHDLPMGLTPSTAAAVTLCRQYDEPIDPAIGDWLISRAHPEGGFFATPAAPIPDLLSTATALHALVSMHRSIDPVQEKTLDFLDALWSSQGAFFGNWEDDVLDCEYTFYGLLALGHLSLR